MKYEEKEFHQCHLCPTELYEDRDNLIDELGWQEFETHNTRTLGKVLICPHCIWKWGLNG